MKKVAVLGGAGFIGSHMCKKLRDEGCYVTSYDIKYPQFGFAPAHEYFIFDLTNEPSFFGSFLWHQYEEVYQFAAEMGGAGYIFTGDNDADIVTRSARINLNVLEACRQAKTKKIFFSSSACVYESLSIFPGDKLDWRLGNLSCAENEGVNPDSPYGVEKLFSEHLYLAGMRNYGIEVRIARLHNIFGEYGTWTGGREKAPAAFARKVAEIKNDGEIECWGDGEQVRSFLHVDECVDGIYRLMQSDFPGPVNIGSSEMVSINQMVGMLADISGKRFAVKHVPGPEGVRGRNSDNSLIEAKLGWKPSRTLREGLERLYPWVEQQVLAAATLSDSVAQK